MSETPWPDLVLAVNALQEVTRQVERRRIMQAILTDKRILTLDIGEVPRAVYIDLEALREIVYGDTEE